MAVTKVTDAMIDGVAASKLTGALPAISGASLTALNATNIGSGTVPTARLGTGTASSTTVLYGDGTYKAEPGGGKILQVVATEITATVTMTSSSYIDLTGMTVNITPTAASSKILVSVTGSAGCSHGDNAKFKLVRLVNSASATDVHVGDAAGSRTRAFYGWGETSSTHADTVSTQFLDSPSYSLTDALTYKVQWAGYAVSRVNTWNRTSTDTDNANFYRGASSIIAWEIAA